MSNKVVERVVCLGCGKPWLGAFWGFDFCNMCTGRNELSRNPYAVEDDDHETEHELTQILGNETPDPEMMQPKPLTEEELDAMYEDSEESQADSEAYRLAH